MQNRVCVFRSTAPVFMNGFGYAGWVRTGRDVCCWSGLHVFHMQSVSLCFRNHFEQKTLLNESAFRIFVAAGHQPLDRWQMPGSVMRPPPCVFGISSLGRARGGLRTCFWGLMDGLLWEKRKTNCFSKTYCITCTNIRKPKCGSSRKSMHMRNAWLFIL